MRNDFVLHLHGFKDHKRITFLNGSIFFDQDINDFSGHGSEDKLLFRLTFQFVKLLSPDIGKWSLNGEEVTYAVYKYMVFILGLFQNFNRIFFVNAPGAPGVAGNLCAPGTTFH